MCLLLMFMLMLRFIVWHIMCFRITHPFKVESLSKFVVDSQNIALLLLEPLGVGAL